MRYLWLTFGLLALALGAIGSVVPLLPTTPFILLAAYAFARSSDRLHTWLLQHRTFGPLIDNWQRYGAISRGAKTAGLVSMIAVFSLSLVMQASTTVLAVQAVVLSASALFIATRPNPPNEE
ncbi:MAG: YbaN family protein [Pseudomonadota bacterium]